MKNIPDSFVRAALGKIGEEPIPGNTRRRWGMMRQLNGTNQRKATFIATDVFDLPTPLAVSLTFSTDGQVFSPTVPPIGNNTVEVDLIRGLDPQSSPVTDHHSLGEGDTQTFCGVLAQSLQVVVGLDGEPPDQLFVAVVVAPVSNIDCADVIGPSAGFLGFDNASQFTVAAAAIQWPAVANVGPNMLRKYLSIQNNSNAALLIGFGPSIDWPAPVGTIILPPSTNAIWEAPTPMFRGQVQYSIDPGVGAPTGSVFRTYGE